ncbi:PREDICTED: G protein pathway suppressor 2 isoform X1 [Chinchilla lanigera]|uniref:G protein pathway suppressor 2 isoform X1 n=1 Tax=Chinchilla lanigera TaxID=34839 RepID=UPI00038EAA5A|nr:PREDICTED: G protein pathway suppressor 2 isoform X1 [Chinchilla lanigera]XP_005399581.1 PREDICTED: G protein pathway suppressor 2 isoform X1 [Chinchilla lanigera]
MPALLERPKLSNAMARALHRHIMMERERKRQEEEEVDKMMEQKMKEEQERRKKKEMEERMSLEETKEQILKLQEKLLALQEEKHQLFLQLKKVLHEEEKRRRKEQSDLTTLTSAAYQQSLTVHTGTHLLSMQGSPGGHNRPGTLMAADRAKQMFGPQVLTTRHYVGSAAAFAGTPEHGQFQGSPGGAYGTAQPPPHYGPTQPAYSPSQQLRAPSAFPAVQYLSQPQPQPYAVHGHFQPTQTGFLQPSGALSLQKQMEHANQQTGFSDSSCQLCLCSLPCAPCIPKLCTQHLDSSPLLSCLCRCNQQESQALPLQANPALGSPSSNTARIHASTTSDHQILSSNPSPMGEGLACPRLIKPTCHPCLLLFMSLPTQGPGIRQSYLRGWEMAGRSTASQSETVAFRVSLGPEYIFQ